MEYILYYKSISLFGFFKEEIHYFGVLERVRVMQNQNELQSSKGYVVVYLYLNERASLKCLKIFIF